MVYLVHIPSKGKYKIGCTRRLRERMNALRTQHKAEIVLLRIIDGDFSEEKRIQKMFFSERIHGEYFKESPEILTFFLNLKESRQDIRDVDEIIEESYERRRRRIEITGRNRN